MHLCFEISSNSNRITRQVHCMVTVKCVTYYFDFSNDHSVLTLQNTDKEANLPLSSNAQTLKCCQLQGGDAGGYNPVIGSRSALAVNVSIYAVQNFP